MFELLPCGEIAREEELDLLDPLRHFRDDYELEGVISSEALTRSSSSVSELLTALPEQTHSVKDKLLNLSFTHQWDSIPRPLSISLVVDASPGCGGLAWPAGQILANYLVQKGPEYVQGKTVLELGSGTGLVGLAVSVLGDVNVLITDQAPILSIMERNIYLNKLEGKVAAVELNWGAPIPPDLPLPDIVLAADCVYFEPAFPLLAQTLSDLSDWKTEILFCYKKRRKADKRFFSFLKKSFTWREVQDDPNQRIYSREAITLIRLFKIKASKGTP